MAEHYLNSHGLQLLWAKIKSWVGENCLPRNNVGKYVRKFDTNHTYAAPMITIGTSDTAWHKMSFDNASTEGSLIDEQIFTVDSSNSVFTCQIPGVYSIEAGANVCGESTGVIGWIYIKNGTYAATKQTNAQYWYPPTSGNHATIVLSASTVVTLSEGDTIEIDVARGSGGALRVLGDYIGITCLSDLNDPSIFQKVATDVHIATRSSWVATNNAPFLASSNAEYGVGVETSNSFSYVDRNNRTFYLMPVDSRASKVTITINDASLTNYRLSVIGYKNDNGTLSQVFASGYTQSTSFTWTQGAIDYITITVQNVNGTNFAWDYTNPNVITVKFSNF